MSSTASRFKLLLLIDVVLPGLDFDFEFVLRSGFSILLLFGFQILGLVQCFLKLRIVFLLEFKFKFRQMLLHST